MKIHAIIAPMKERTPKRFALIGLPGSGKSTYAVRIGTLLNIPVHHLDSHLFEQDGRKKDKKEFLSIEEAMVKEEAWVVEGCSLSTLATRFKRADAVVYFNFSRLLCVFRILKRSLFFDEALKETGCLRGVNLRLIRYIWNFEKEKRAGIESLRRAYPHVNFIELKSPKDAEQFLNNLKRSL